MRSCLGFFVASMCVSICALGENRLLADEPESLGKLRQEKLAAAEQRYDAVKAAFLAGTLPVSDVYSASRGWKEAAYEAAKTKADRTRALEQHRDRMAVQYKHIKALMDVNAKGGEADTEASARFWLLEAKIWVLEDARKPSEA